MSSKKNFHKCKTCKIVLIDTSDLYKSPFGGYTCTRCIERQFEKEIDDSDVLMPFQLDVFKESQIPVKNDTNMGVKLYNLKKELTQFNYDLKHYEQKIGEKIDALKLTIDINLNYCKNKIDKQKISQLNQLDIYKNQMLDQVDLVKIETQKSKLFEKKERLNKFEQPNYTVTMTEIDNLTSELNKQLVDVNILVHGNKKFFNEIPYRKNLSLNDIGHLEFENEDQPSSVEKKLLEQIQSSPYFNPINLPNIYLEVKSFHILTDTMIVVCHDLKAKKIRIKVFNIKNFKLGNELILDKTKFFFRVCADLNYFLTLDSTEADYEIILYDERLKVLTQTKILPKDFIIIDAFLDHHLFVLIKDNTLRLKVYSSDLNEIKTMELENIEMFQDTNDYKINVIEFNLYVCGKFLFGTRINQFNYSTGDFLRKIDLFYFFDKFYIDLKTEHVIFFCDNHFYMFSIEKNKVISKMTCENLDKSICHFDSNRQGNVYILMPHL